MKDELEAIDDLASTQWGLVTTAQLEARGVSRLQTSRMAARGQLRRIRHGVYAVAGAPSGELEDIRAAWLSVDPGRTLSERISDVDQVVVTHESAARIHGFGDLDDYMVHISAPHRYRPSSSDILSETSPVGSKEWELLDGLPVSTPRRTLEELSTCGRWDPEHVLDAIEDAVAKGATTKESIGKSKVLVEIAPHLAEPANAQSVRKRLADDAKKRGVAPQQVQGDFYRALFIARLHELDPSWVVKGGMAMQARFGPGRATKDIDLFHRQMLEVESAAAELVATMSGQRVGAFMFICDAPSARDEAIAARVPVRVLAGAQETARFDIDVSAPRELGMTGEVVVAGRLDEATIPGYPRSFRVSLYPLENQAADKLCAMYERHRGGPSTRYRDLYDLAVLCDKVDPETFSRALGKETALRGVTLPASIVPPSPEWASEYERVVSKLAGTDPRWHSWQAASEHVNQYLAPAMSRVRADAAGATPGPSGPERARTVPGTNDGSFAPRRRGFPGISLTE